MSQHAKWQASEWLGRRGLAVAALLVGLAASAGLLAGLAVVSGALDPVVARLDDYEPSTITRMYAADGTAIAEFASERRLILEYDDFPPSLVQGLVAVEDAGFFEHGGFNYRGIARALAVNVATGRLVEGGSSLTQQLAKVLFLSPERSAQRKFSEALLAIDLERHYSKEEILTHYLNQVYLGHNRYGVGEAARFYFGKPARALELHEAAFLAGLPQRPSGYSPYANPGAAGRRRDHVLRRMAAVGAISSGEAEEAMRRPLGVLPRAAVERELAPYFVEEVRQQLEERYGERGVYHDGLQVRTTLHRELQKVAERALEEGLLAVDRRQGWRGASHNVLRDGEGVTLEEWSDPAWPPVPAPGSLIRGLVMSVSGDGVSVRVGRRTALLDQAPAWTGNRNARALFESGDVGLFRVVDIPDDETIVVAIEQEPEIEAALVAIEVETGRIVAMVGGWDFQRSRFNRATQARRQTGSAFKPILYGTALEGDADPTLRLFDEPISIQDRSTGAVYAPVNHDGAYHGLTTLRTALEQSRNPVAVQLLGRVGAERVIDTARRLGISAELEPYPSLALGAFEVSLLEMTSAYAAIADQGRARPPYLIEQVMDGSGRSLFEARPRELQALSPEAAYLTTQLLNGVIQNGTGRRARELPAVLAGKTGTTDGYTDAWFIGYSPRIACGVWVGRDRKESIGPHEDGARVALPVWTDFMAAAIAAYPAGDFPRPANIEYAEIDKETGLLARAACRHPFREAFRRGTAPVRYCSEHEHTIIALPYDLQKLMLAEDTAPPPDLMSIASRLP